MLKNKILIIFLLLLFFHLSSQQHPAQSKTEQPKFSDYCTLLKAENMISPVFIKTKAFMSYSTVTRVDGGDTHLYSPKCNNADYFALASFSDSVNSSPKWKSFFDNLPSEKNFIFEVELTGELNISLIPAFGHLGWSRAEINIAKIESIKNISDFAKKPDSNKESPIVDLGTSLKEINTSLMFFFLNGGSEIDINGIIATDFILTDPTGSTFSKKGLSNFFDKDIFGRKNDYSSLEVGSGTASQVNNQYKVSGNFSFNDDRNNPRRFSYENFYKKTNDGWLLVKSSFSAR